MGLLIPKNSATVYVLDLPSASGRNRGQTKEERFLRTHPKTISHVELSIGDFMGGYRFTVDPMGLKEAQRRRRFSQRERWQRSNPHDLRREPDSEFYQFTKIDSQEQH